MIQAQKILTKQLFTSIIKSGYEICLPLDVFGIVVEYACTDVLESSEMLAEQVSYEICNMQSHYGRKYVYDHPLLGKKPLLFRTNYVNCGVVTNNDVVYFTIDSAPYKFLNRSLAHNIISTPYRVCHAWHDSSAIIVLFVCKSEKQYNDVFAQYIESYKVKLVISMSPVYATCASARITRIDIFNDADELIKVFALE
jgi:hypothetical protein